MASRPAGTLRRHHMATRSQEMTPAGAAACDSVDEEHVGVPRSPSSAEKDGPVFKPTLSWVSLVGVTFFAVCGGDYGLEDSVGAGGARLTLLGVFLLPWFWSLPIGLMTAELGSMIPEAGGCVVWVHRALGPFWAQQNAMWNLVSNTFDNALYPVMFVDYLVYFPAFRLDGLSRWLVSVAMLVAVTLLNIQGVDVVANASNVFALLVISPFAGLVVAGLPQLPDMATFLEAIRPSDYDPPIRWGAFLSVLLWNTSGYDSVGALAAEVQRPGRDFPIAMIVTIILVTLVYLLPLAVAVALDSKQTRQWSDGHFVLVASEHIGDWLAAWITIGGALSAVGLLNTLLCTSARVAVSAARLHVLPSSLAAVHQHSGTPRRATLAISLVLAVACALPFSQLVSISMLFYGATTFTEFLALIVLREREPLTPRPFRVPLSNTPLWLACIPPMGLCLLLVCLAPPEAWVLFVLTCLVAVLAHVRTHCMHRLAAWVPRLGVGAPHAASRSQAGYGSVDTSAVSAQLVEARLQQHARKAAPAYDCDGSSDGDRAPSIISELAPRIALLGGK